MDSTSATVVLNHSAPGALAVVDHFRAGENGLQTSSRIMAARGETHDEFC